MENQMIKKQDLEQAIEEAYLELYKFETALDELGEKESNNSWKEYYTMTIKLINERIEFLKLELSKIK